MTYLYIDTITNLQKDIETKICQFDKPFEVFCNGMDSFQKVIEDFFAKDGEEARLREMFKYLKMDKDYKPVDCLDVNYSSKIFEDYNEGMKKFLYEIFELRNTDKSTLNEYEKNLSIASENDSQFIESLFGGVNNQRRSEDVRDAVSNVTFLIDFIKSLQDYKNDVSSLISDEQYSTDSIQARCCKLYLSSITNYCSQMINEILSTYYKILKSIENREEKKKGPDKLVVF